MAIILIVHEDGVPFAIVKKIKCKFGRHTHRVGFRKHINKYYCQSCKAPRKHPELRAVDGGKKDFSTSFKF